MDVNTNSSQASIVDAGMCSSPVESSPSPSSPGVDTHTAELSKLMAAAAILVRQCESKLSEWRGRGAERTLPPLLAAEINSLLNATAELYRRASASARAARQATDSLVALAHLEQLSERERSMVLTNCAHAYGALEQFSEMLMELESTTDKDMARLRKPSATCEYTPFAAEMFERLMATTRRRD